MSSAGCACAAFAAWFALDALECSPWLAMGASWWFAFGDVVWQRANRTDVHGLEVGFETLALAFAIRFAWKGDGRWGIAACAAAGCALATHPNSLWALPGIAIMLLSRRGLPYPQAAAALLGPLIAYAYIPLRSAYLVSHRVDPTLAIGVPPGQPFWNYGDPHTIAGFWWLLSGAQWSLQTHGAMLGMLSPVNYIRGAELFAAFARDDHGWFALLVAGTGLIALAVRAPRIAIGLMASALCWMAFVQCYQATENDPARYLLSVYWVETVVASGLWFVLRNTPRVASVVALLVIAISVTPLWTDRARFLENADPLAMPYIDRVIRETGARDVVVAQWTYATPLGYAKYVENRMRDRIVVNGGPPDGDWLIARLAAQRPTDIVLERVVAIPGVTLRPLDHAFPTVFRVTPEKAASSKKRRIQ